MNAETVSFPEFQSRIASLLARMPREFRAASILMTRQDGVMRVEGIALDHDRNPSFTVLDVVGHPPVPRCGSGVSPVEDLALVFARQLWRHCPSVTVFAVVNLDDDVLMTFHGGEERWLFLVDGDRAAMIGKQPFEGCLELAREQLKRAA
jgi:hypothetical protein